MRLRVWLFLAVLVGSVMFGILYRHDKCSRTKCPAGLRAQFIVTSYSSFCVCAPLEWVAE
jgi:hypothetical protein